MAAKECTANLAKSAAKGKEKDRAQETEGGESEGSDFVEIEGHDEGRTEHKVRDTQGTLQRRKINYFVNEEAGGFVCHPSAVCYVIEKGLKHWCDAHKSKLTPEAMQAQYDKIKGREQ